MIFLILGEAGHGKDTVGEIIQRELGEKAVTTHYAGYLKWMYANFFGWDGVKDEVARQGFQEIGTDLIRETYDEDFWVDRIVEQIQIFGGKFNHFIIPDARFFNEIEKVVSAFGEENVVTIRVFRPNAISKLTKDQLLHRSETELADYRADYLISNDTLIQLERDVEAVINNININKGGL